MNLREKGCTGCGLCVSQCPQNAIVMHENKEGFLYPVIDQQKCNECGLCASACEAYKAQSRHKEKPLQVKACQTKDVKWLIESTAGGFFPTLAQWVIEQGGVVFGTAYDAEMNPIVCKATTIEEICRFNGSKYVQSDLSKALADIKKELENGKQVLFSGTPCQVAAVKTLCNEYVDNKLITMDVVCYGVPSPGLFRAFLRSMEEKMQARITDYRFRDKHKNGWSHTTVITMIGKDEKELYYEEEDYSKVPYYKMFGTRDCFRKECYACKYNTIERISDFTTGNFWGIEGMTDFFNTHNGVSMLLLNTDKARKLFEKVADRFLEMDMTLEQAITANDALVHTCRYPDNRDKLYRCFYKHGFEAMYKKFYTDNAVLKLKRKIKTFLKRLIGYKK